MVSPSVVDPWLQGPIGVTHNSSLIGGQKKNSLFASMRHNSASRLSLHQYFARLDLKFFFLRFCGHTGLYLTVQCTQKGENNGGKHGTKVHQDGTQTQDDHIKKRAFCTWDTCTNCYATRCPTLFCLILPVFF